MKKHLLHQIWAWTSLAINILVSSIVYEISFDQKGRIVEGLILGVGFFLLGLNKIIRIINLNDQSAATLWITYVGTFGLSLMRAYQLYHDTLQIPFILMFMIVLECIVALIFLKK